MSTDLNKKNEFVLALRDHLQSKYSTQHNYTFGESDFEGKKQGGGYNLVRRDPNKPKDISGFCFRKDLCSWITPKEDSALINDVFKFSQQYKNIESLLEDKGESLKLKLGNTEYFVSTHIAEGYMGEITVYLIKSFPFNKQDFGKMKNENVKSAQITV